MTFRMSRHEPGGMWPRTPPWYPSTKYTVGVDSLCGSAGPAAVNAAPALMSLENSRRFTLSL